MNCNHCGKPIDKIEDFAFFRVKKKGKWVAAELCTKCHEKLTHIVEQFCTRGDSNG